MPVYCFQTLSERTRNEEYKKKNSYVSELFISSWFFSSMNDLNKKSDKKKSEEKLVAKQR